MQCRHTYIHTHRSFMQCRHNFDTPTLLENSFIREGCEQHQTSTPWAYVAEHLAWPICVYMCVSVYAGMCPCAALYARAANKITCLHPESMSQNTTACLSVYMYVYCFTSPCLCLYVCTCTYTYTHTHRHICIYTQACSYIHAYTYTYTYTYTIHIHMHTHTHIRWLCVFKRVRVGLRHNYT